MIGQTVSHYKILDKLGEGGMGVVYKAQDTRLNRMVALKFLPHHLMANTQSKERFLQEARATSALDHPNVSVIHEIGDTEDGGSFICMNYYNGETLKEILKRNPPDTDRSIKIALQIAKGLECAHEAEIIHRDIKPGNIIITEKGEVKIVDFGLAKLMDESGFTESGIGIGTLPYMSPEQLQGKKVDLRTDLYSLGIIMYEMVTGRRPFLEEHYAALMYSIINTEPPPPSVLNPSVPELLEDIILKLIHKDPEQRIDSATELIEQLENVPKSKKTGPLLTANAAINHLNQPKKVVLALFIILIITTLSVPSARNSLLQFAGPTTTPEDIHLVVLPFVNVGEDIQNKAFNDGLVEVLTSSLTMIQPEGLSYWVVSASEVRQRNVTSARDALKEFNATVALYGSTQRLTDRVRLTLNLVDTKTGRQINSRVLTVPVESLPRLQMDAVTALTGMLDMDKFVGDRVDSFNEGTSNPRSYQLYLEGIGYLQNYQIDDNITQATSLFEKAIELDPEYALAYAGLAEAYWRRFDVTRDIQWTDLSLQYAQKAIELNSRTSEVLITIAFIQNEMHQYEQVLETLDKLEGMNSRIYSVLIERARAFEGLRKLEEAEESYLEAIEQRKNYWGGYHYLGLFYYKQGDFKKAADEFRMVTILTPDNFRAFNNLGGVYLAMEMIDEAKNAFEQSLRIQPNHRALMNLGTLHFYQKNYDDAVITYEQAVRLLDTDYRTWGYLGYAYYWSGADSIKVRATLEKAIELANKEREITPENPRLLSQLAGYHIIIGNREKAKNLLSEITSQKLSDPQLMGTVADLYEQLGDRESGLYWMEEALAHGLRLFIVENIETMQDLLRDPRMIELRKKYEQ